MAHRRGNSLELPEVVPSSSPEVATPPGLHSAMVEPHDGLHAISNADKVYRTDTVVAASHAADHEGKIVHENKRGGFFGWSRRKTWIVAGVALLVVIAIVVGVAVGVTTGNSSSDSDNSDNTEESSPTLTSAPTTTNTAFGTPTSFPDSDPSDSACYDTICPAVLAAAQPDPEEPTFFIFALGLDNEYWFRETNGEEWVGDWESIGGEFVSQPAAISMSSGRIDVFGVWEGDLTMRTKAYRSGTWELNWRDLEGRCYSPPSLCVRGDGLLHVFTLSSDQELAWKTFEDNTWPSEEDPWNRAITGTLASSPYAACDEERMELVSYGETNRPYELMIKNLNESESDVVLGFWEPQGGDFQGDPSIFLFGANRMDAFGIGVDSDMYHASWPVEEPTELGDGLRSIGGEFESVASALVTGIDRVDVVAVGTDGRLKQNVLVDDEWAEWADLGGFFSSAPLALRLNDTNVAVFGIGLNGQVFHGLWEVGDDNAWGNGRWFADGGNISSSWHRPTQA